MNITKMIRSTALVLAGPVALTFAGPAAAEQWPLAPGDYTEVTGIDIADGGDLAYAKWIATQWADNQKFAISKGWIKSYNIYYNVHKRQGEPSMFLSVTYTDWADNAEQEARAKAYQEHMKRTNAQLDAESGDRAKFRTVMSTTLLQEVTPR